MDWPFSFIFRMGGCASKPKKKHDKYEDNKDEVEDQAKV